MSGWEKQASDIEIVEKFQTIHSRKRVPSLWGYRMQMKALYPRLLKILLDGLEHEPTRTKFRPTSVSCEPVANPTTSDS